MRQNTRVTFAMRDLDRLKCIQAVVDGDLKLVRASERLGLTTRQVRRLARRYADFGPTLATEKLRERHGVDLAVETVRSLMVAGGLWLPRRLRRCIESRA
jgi:Helix-turn-helix domain